MPAPAPALLPLFRSGNQLRLLAALFLAPDHALSVGELTAETGVPQPSVSREVAALRRAGLLAEERVHGRRVYRADTSALVFPELASLLLKTAGPKPVLERALAGLPGIARALVYGSWALRYAGVPGPPPQDVDLLVVGTPDVAAVRRRAQRASDELGRDVNATVLSPREWAEPNPFVGNVRSSTSVELDLAAAP
jgi:DNA-binding transcriptional ArsR family regulator